ncbi:uncharacterized protein PpBr36_09424 [Pyricularia pennisetigena]|uniref:uncharacterized protein n=1 Tax=Pyricularia pennisetigena TaxID=1578925 RepID=UPI00114FEB7C|nr:uncharacterized protein PpBr36_09424 [Pyricularia pennisetigena]TLS21938.1 hypothetical protein PpBr36_09424 [Pyricularia pennisetigena]
MAASEAVTSVELTTLPKIATGKVRDLFTVDDKTLLFVASDRTSAYDVVMANGVPGKGVILNLATVFWFKLLTAKVAGLKTHFLGTDAPASLSEAEKAIVRNRSMRVRRLKVFPVEAIVRGYVAGSAWAEYKASGTVHGLQVPAGLRQCDKLPRPMYTPSTKAEQGDKDVNITPAQAAEIVGDKYAAEIERLALAVYEAAADYAAGKGIIIADTKFEFGLDEETDEVVLVDEVLTPDSSRFWPKDKYEAGRDQESFDKQFIRNWLTANGLKGKEGVVLPEDVVKATRGKYEEVFKMLTGKAVEEALKEGFPRYNDYDDSTTAAASDIAQPSVLPAVPSPPGTASSWPSESEIYGPDRFDGPGYAPYYGPDRFNCSDFGPDYEPDRFLGQRQAPVILTEAALAELRDEPDLTLDDVPDIGYQCMLEGRAAAAQGISIKDRMALEAGQVTPGLDDTEHLQYAIEAITKDFRRGGPSNATDSNQSDYYDPSIPDYDYPAKYTRHPGPRGVTPPPNGRMERDLHLQKNQSQRKARSEKKRDASISQPSSQSTLVRHGQPPGVADVSKETDPRNTGKYPDRFEASSARSKTHLCCRPRALQQQSLAILMALCVVIIALLMFCAIYSQTNSGFVNYNGTIYGGQFFVFRMLPQLLASVVLFYSQAVLMTTLRILPFARLAQSSVYFRSGALFDDIYRPSIYLFPRLPLPLRPAPYQVSIDPRDRPYPGRPPKQVRNHNYRQTIFARVLYYWDMCLPLLMMWLVNFTIPLQSSLFTVVYIGDDTWRWATVQGVAWTLVALYLGLFLAIFLTIRYWQQNPITGLAWDIRSIADVAALVSHGNHPDSSPAFNLLQDYRDTEVMASRDELRWALRDRDSDRLAMWEMTMAMETRPRTGNTAEFENVPMRGNMIEYGLGSARGHELDLARWRSAKYPITQKVRDARERIRPQESQRDTATEKDEEDIDIEASPHNRRVRYRWLPWCFRTRQLVFFIIAMVAMLITLLAVSFAPATNIQNGFLPGVRAGPVDGSFSSANFLYSFLPAFLGMLMFLSFQILDMWLRILQPWGELTAGQEGALPERSMLADYAACVPLQAAYHAYRNRHWRVAAIHTLSVVFVLIPVVGGGMFMALTTDENEVRMVPNIPAFGFLLALLAVYLVALASFLHGRGPFKLPHGVTCLAEIISFLANDDVVDDKVFHDNKLSKSQMMRKMGVGKPIQQQTRWRFGLGAGRDGRLGVRRVVRFTESPRSSRRSRKASTTGAGGKSTHRDGSGGSKYG